jgi:hypothetical protein
MPETFPALHSHSSNFATFRWNNRFVNSISIAESEPSLQKMTNLYV